MSVKSLMRSGMISHSAGAKLQVLKGTRPQPSKMAAFDGKERDDGKGTMGHAIARKGQINGPDQKPSHMSKGGKEPEGRTPTRSQINTYPAGQSKKFPHGAAMGKAKKKVGVTGGVAQSGPSGPTYGGGGRSTQ